MALKINNLQINRHLSPATAQIHLSDEDNCAVIVQVKLEGKPVEQFSLQELTSLALVAAKHLTQSV